MVATREDAPYLRGVVRRKVKSRPGGRAARVVAAVIDAAIAEISRVGFAAFRIEDVADLAGVAKTTVYRRWPTKASLVMEAMRSVHGAVEVPDTGTLRGDLRALLGDLARGMNGTAKRALARALLAAGPEPEMKAELAAFRRERLARWRVILERGVKRGELPRSVDVALVTELLTSPLALRVLRGESIDAKGIDALVDLVLTGATGQPKVRSRKRSAS